MIIDALTSALPVLQAEAEAMMTATATVVRPGEVVEDPITHADVVTSAPVYTGRCKLQTSALEAQSAESGGGTVTISRPVIHFPIGAGPFQIGDMVTVAGRKYRIQAVPTKTWATAQRLPVEEINA